MYWPIGTPRIYAATPHNIVFASHDGAVQGSTEKLEETGPSDGLENNPKLSGEAQEIEPPTASNGPKKKASLDYGHDDNRESALGDEILGAQISRNGHVFVTITRSTVTVWQTKPTAVVASVLRSPHSLKTYGTNVDILLRPDTAIVVVQTSRGYLITYTLATDPFARLYQPVFPEYTPGHSRRRSLVGKTGFHLDPYSGPGEGHGIREFSIRFRMVIKVDAGISKAIALDTELLVATKNPPAIQSVRWQPDKTGSQASTTLLKTLPWLDKKSFVCQIVHDRPMNLSTWITNDGKCYAVQNTSSPETEDIPFTGHCFHTPDSEMTYAVEAAISARFSLIAIACKNSDVLVYTARDYAGHIPLSHRLHPPANPEQTGLITCLSYSPDGYALFVGYENGWAIWSVYGKLGAHSFSTDRSISFIGNEQWLLGVKSCFWIGGGAKIVLLTPSDNRLWSLDLARSAVTGCFSSANVARSLLQTPTGFMLYRGYDLPDLGTIALETGLWHRVQIPASYLHKQWPIRSSVISTDGRYVAVAGRRGLAHYSVTSGRWKTFDDPAAEDEFTVRGGMCWHQHVLIAAVESNDGFQIRIYSRESALDNTSIMHVQPLSAPIVHLAPSGEDSLLVYTYENQLYHFIISVSNASVRLVRVGQIALHGIIRAPPRVRALSWILTEDQLENGDPSQDVGIATVIFLVDGKLVVLQPSAKDSGELKYDMRIVAHNVEYYVLMRDQKYFNSLNQASPQSLPETTETDVQIAEYHKNDLRDSLWYFDGTDIHVWTDTQELLASAPPELGRELPPTVCIPTDFYPLSILLSKAILFGIEPDILQRRDTTFSIVRFMTRTKLFLPQILRHHLSQYNAPSALYLAHHYSPLTYAAHALEVLLHDVLDHEVDTPSPSGGLLPAVITLLHSSPAFLDIIVACTRKTDARAWRTLFAHLPTPRELFDESLAQGKLVTAGGYLLVLQTLEEAGEDEVVTLMGQAKEKREWELCKELARFLMAMDASGETLKRSLQRVGLNVDK